MVKINQLLNSIRQKYFNLIFKINPYDYNEALYSNNIEKIKAYISKGVDINKPDTFGITPLHRAWDNPEMAETLIKYGANVNAKDNYGNTPLMSLCKNFVIDFSFKDEQKLYQKKVFKVAIILMIAKTDINISNNKQETALLHALDSKNEQMVAFLLESGADLFSKDVFLKNISRMNPSMVEVICDHVHKLDQLKLVFEVIKDNGLYYDWLGINLEKKLSSLSLEQSLEVKQDNLKPVKI